MRPNAPQEYAEAKKLHAAGLGPYTIARRLGVPSGTVRSWLSGKTSEPRSRAGRVPNKPLREALEASTLSMSDVCYRLGWVRRKGSRTLADVSRLTRGLGMRPYANPSGNRTYQSTLAVERAKEICDAIGADFDTLYPELPTIRRRRSFGRCSCCRLALARKAEDGLCGFCREVLEARGVSSCAA